MREWPESSRTNHQLDSRKKAWSRTAVILAATLLCFGTIGAITYTFLVATLFQPYTPTQITNGLQRVVNAWREPTSQGSFQFEWRDDFSRDIIPKNCHSHNDYLRTVPLYEALAAGCVGVEADIWVTDEEELLVGHTWKSTKKERTLRSLYLDPLANIFIQRNVSLASADDKEIGIFDTNPNVSTILLIDFKNNPKKTWPILLTQLQPFREKGWLTYFNGTELVPGPLTIVATGDAPFDLIQANNTDRFVFLDAPLDDISNPAYTSENSYYASVSLSQAVGHVWFNRLSSKQVDIIKTQIKAAADKGLKSRYWSTPSWPISFRDKIWFTLVSNHVGMLNVDDLAGATRWNWHWCVIAGLRLCDNS
ncbi:hypothetical protein P154DRAFT_420942 [Amniculicola lignicola CBS 123094]|uniref:Altered inheritance of mitochondria protein 6 n=1 Tax=Amniculicola lignicola CBS 123094 TaxID=1392246 RepID=A0A6A5WYL6_9PLEO|nr:hypothetical protein P154DRAFT_420942 [Amniculicola lignicola CBS 123094]